MRMTVLAYDGLGSTLTVECSATEELADGSDGPLMFVGRTSVARGDVRAMSRAQMVHAVARELMEIAVHLADRDAELELR